MEEEFIKEQVKAINKKLQDMKSEENESVPEINFPITDLSNLSLSKRAFETQKEKQSEIQR